MADQITPLGGKTTVDDKVLFEAQRLSYDAARVIAEKIARRISERTKGREVVVAGTQLLADMSNLVATRSVLEQLAHDYDALAKIAHALPPAVPRGALTRGYITLAATVAPGLEAVSAGVQSALTLISLFRQDVDYKGVPISIDTLAFELELAARLRMHKAKEVVVPDFAVFTAPATGAGTVIALLENVKVARAEAMKALVPKDSHPSGHDPKPGASHKTMEEGGGDLFLLDSRGADANQESVAPALAQLDQRLNDLQTQLAKGDADGSGLTMLARLFRLETIAARSPIFVHVRVVLAGGSNRVQHSLWHSMFTGDGLSSSGGAVVSWAILNVNGAVEDGGVFAHSMSAASPKPPETPPSIS